MRHPLPECDISDMNDLCFYHPSWPVLFEDNHLLVLYKPSGLLVQGDITGELSLLDLGKAWLKERYQKPGRVFLGLVHRLDRPVAGVIAFARTSKAAARLSEQFRSGKTQKRYLAVVEGMIGKESGRLVHHVERVGHLSRIVSSPTPISQEATLVYKLLDSYGSRSLVQVQLETGRHHQIRLQLAHIGHPIVGDVRYGAKAALPEERIALLAHELVLEHPTRKEALTFRSPFPHGWPWRMSENGEAPPWDWSELRSIVHLPETFRANASKNK